MSDPTLTKARVTIRYEASDGYDVELGYKAPNEDFPKATPKGVLLDSLEELARITALFGFEDEALEKFNAARQRVAEFKAKRKS